MARKIDTLVANAWNNDREFNGGNTRIYKMFGALWCELWGNLIACKDLATGKTTYQTTGYNTPTTRARLNACGCACHISGGIMVYCETGRPVGAWTIRDNAAARLVRKSA